MQIMSRLSDADFFDREAELSRLLALAKKRHGTTGLDEPQSSTNASDNRPLEASRRPRNGLVLGAPRSGKTELLRKTFDRLFTEQSECVPIYLALRTANLEPERFASEYISQFLSQLIAFRRQDARFIALADEPLKTIAQNSLPDDYLWVRNLVESFTRAKDSGDLRMLLRCAFSAPVLAATRAKVVPVIMVDNFHLLADVGRPKGGATRVEGLHDVRAEFFRAFTSTESSGVLATQDCLPVYILCGLRRLLTEMLPPEEGVFDNLELLRVEPMAEEPLERMIRATANGLGVELSDSATELMIQQLGGDLFYTRALIDAAAADNSRLKSFMELERLYTGEVLQGRICHYLDAVFRDLTPVTRSRRAAIETLSLLMDASSPVSIEAVIERASAFTSDADGLLERMHAREIIEVTYGFVLAPTDPVLCDYVRAKYRTEIAGVKRPVAGEELLGEKLKHSYRLMMSRYYRSVEQQLVDLLSRVDFQSVPASLFDVLAYEKQYRGLSRAQARQQLEEETERLRLPQIVLVNDLGECEIQNSSCRLYSAGGFDGGIYSDANEALWVIAVINAKEPVEGSAIQLLEQRLQAAARSSIFGNQSRAIHWYISKEGFTDAALTRMQEAGLYQSTYTQLDLLSDYLVKIAPRTSEFRATKEVELVIPIEDEAELIAARTVEQIARAASFDKESINQIKTALIEACINAAEHSDSPDRKIYHRFSIIDDRLVISVTNKGKAFDGVTAPNSGNGSESLKGTRGRGLKIIRGLMDEVRFERTDEGTTLVMTKLLKRQEKQ